MSVRIINADVMDGLAQLADDSVHCVVTSPPYWGLRDYGVPGQLGLEPTLGEHVEAMVRVFREVRRVLRKDGTLWLNYGDCYAGSWGAQSRPNGNDIGSTLQGGSMLSARQIQAHPKQTQTGSLKNTPGLKPKDLCGVPWRIAFALQADGWWLRQDIIWSKPNPMPESIKDRCTKAHEYLFLLAKSERYYFDAEAIAEAANPAHFSRYKYEFTGSKPGQAEAMPNGYTIHPKGMRESHETRNKRSVWEIATQPFPEAHFATFPPALIEPCIKAGTSERGCCAKCGAPSRRETDGATYYDGKLVGSDPQRKYGDREYGRGPKNNLGSSIAQTIGWQPSCKCETSTVSCAVLDPFGGSGTTGLVADRLKRNAILIELNPEYAAMAEKRVKGDCPLFSEVSA